MNTIDSFDDDFEKFMKDFYKEDLRNENKRYSRFRAGLFLRKTISVIFFVTALVSFFIFLRNITP